MKRLLALSMVFFLTISLLAACGGNSDSDTENPGNNESSTGNVSTTTVRDVIKASALISNEDAAAILGQGVEDGTIAVQKPFNDEVRYEAESYTLAVALSQEALYDKDSDLQKSLMENGWSSYMQQMEKAYVANYYEQNIVELSGMAGASYLQEGIGFGTWLLHVFCDDYYITLSLSNASMNHEDSEDEILWKHEKLKEAGNLAVKHLKAILE